MCVLAPGPRAVCKCPFGLLLAEDGLSCSSLVDSAFLLMLSPSSVTKVQHGGSYLPVNTDPLSEEFPYISVRI